jgi:hypothetical protein
MRTTLIIILITLILLLGGAWAYLLLNGAPKSVADIRQSLFGGSNTIVTTLTPTPVVESEPAEARTIPLASPLIEVTDRAVAGAIIAQVGSSTVLRYMEKGTGHVYEVSLETGLETRISNTTIPGATHATWAPQGTRAVVETDTQGNRGSMFLGTLSTSTTGYVFDLEGLTDTLENIAFGNKGELFYTVAGDGGTVALARDLRTGSTAEIFRLPFTQSTVLWDIWGKGNHYAYTKPAYGYTGYLYRIDGGALTKIAQGQTLSAVRPEAVAFLITQDGGTGSYSTLLRTDTSMAPFMDIHATDAKCAGDTSVIWCAASAEAGAGFPVAWYQGTVSYDDSIYRVDPKTGVSTLELDPEAIARVPIDATDLAVGPDGRVIFRNKIDDSLWLLNPSSGF